MLATIPHPASAGATAPTLVIAHGLYGSGRNWGVIARRLADQRDVVAVDMRNHGESPRFPTQSYPDMAADLADRKSTRLNSSHLDLSRMPSSA